MLWIVKGMCVVREIVDSVRPVELKLHDFVFTMFDLLGMEDLIGGGLKLVAGFVLLGSVSVLLELQLDFLDDCLLLELMQLFALTPLLEKEKRLEGCGCHGNGN